MTVHAPSTLATHAAPRSHAVRTAEGPRSIRRRRPNETVPPTELDPASRQADAERLARALGRWYVEVLVGRRDSRQLRGLLTPVAEHRVRTSVLRHTTARRRKQRSASSAAIPIPVVRSTRVQAVSGRYEAIAIVASGDRVTAVVSVLHPTDKGWIVSELARPEDHLPAQPVPTINP